MNVSTIKNGIVIDHIRAGFGIKVIEYLKIDTAAGLVAFIMNAESKKHGRKDIVKIENVDGVDLTALGLIDHNATVNIIKNGERTKKITLSLPDKVTNIIRCKNPRCVTSAEKAIPHIFHKAGGDGTYRCDYCDELVRVEDDWR